MPSLLRSLLLSNHNLILLLPAQMESHLRALRIEEIFLILNRKDLLSTHQEYQNLLSTTVISTFQGMFLVQSLQWGAPLYTRGLLNT
nr:hypothetical protein Iba_chr05cCG17370 [Ipomoea batatas]GMD06885.1 hypothetical protein Iba_scaffold39553CG0010 [Ipomoea batatas]